MDLQIIEKGQTFDIEVASKAKSAYYFGAGWDNPNGPVDLDIVCVMTTDGKLTDKSHLIYFGNRNAPGVQLSADNTTGDGDGDDESIVINTNNLDASIDGLIVGLAAYAGADLSNAPNPHFRVVDGDNETDEQLADIKLDGATSPGDTVLVAFKLNKTDNGWTLDNVGEFHKCGQGSDAIKGFAGLFQ